MPQKKSAAAKKIEPPVEAKPETRLRLVSDVKKSRVEPLPSAPQRKGLSGAGEPGETTTEDIWLCYHKARKAKKLDDDVELELIQRAVLQSAGNKSQAARLLGISRPRLLRRLDEPLSGLLHDASASDDADGDERSEDQ